MKTKFCGITNPHDAEAIAEAGADYIGLILEPSSPRFADDAQALEVSRARSGASLVGVFVNQSDTEIARAIDRYRLDAVQLHGAQSVKSADFLRGRGAQIWRTFWLENDGDVAEAENFRADKIVADARSGSLAGGTGMLSNWRLAAKLAAKIPLALAGGLSENNALAAAREVAPEILDFNSAVEISPRKKDILKIKQIIQTIKNNYEQF